MNVLIRFNEGEPCSGDPDFFTAEPDPRDLRTDVPNWKGPKLQSWERIVDVPELTFSRWQSIAVLYEMMQHEMDAAFEPDQAKRKLHV